MKACAAVAGSKWEDVGIYLDVGSASCAEIRGSTSSYFTRTFKVLEFWKKAAKSPTVRQLLSTFRLVGVSRKAIERKFEKISEKVTYCTV